jgi:hypothetical protein
MGLSEWWNKLLGRSPASAEEPRSDFDPAPPKRTPDEQAVVDEKQQELLGAYEQRVDAEQPSPGDSSNP